MMVKPSSKQAKINTPHPSMDHNHKIHKLKEEPHLSGAYIRSLVKHLTSIKPKDSSNVDSKAPESVNSNSEYVTDHNNTQPESPSPPPPPPPAHKKQVRRRRQTSKPYQERLLNMAEARREIVTALKFHRASMKQRETETVVAATTATTDLSSNHLEYNSSLSCSPSIPYYWPISNPPPLPPLSHENLDFTLPNQTLGLNLNFQDFINLDTNLYHNPLSNCPTSSSSSSSSSSSTLSSAAISQEVAAGVSEEVVTTTATTSSSSSSSSGAMMSGGMHHAMDDEGMEEIRTLGEQHQMEWNDTVNILMSARWFEFLKTIEIEHDDGRSDFNDEIIPFDQVIEFPKW